ncbi:hypothetical protein ABT124_07660 [Streptomyces sp. NPDC001982]|uniref:hypothetical protein n=1 Tax=Streptomyces sp. NPDC001982 TaxID=3154405 RepID=UPI003321D608
MSLVTILAVYPFALLYDGLIAEHFHSWPLHWRTANFPIFLAPLLTYAVMPWLSRVLRRTRRRGPCRPGRPDFPRREGTRQGARPVGGANWPGDRAP